jgi:hypothetical protein
MPLPARSTSSPAFPVEEFVQVLSAQLDRAQDALALKARTGRPLTFALKDLSVDLKVFWDSQRDGRMLLRHAAPNEEGASTLRLSFTTITRAMVEENTVAFAQEEDPRALGELGAKDSLHEDDRRKLELVGVRTVGQLKRMTEGTDARQMGALLDIPINRMQQLLMQSARPAVVASEPVRQAQGRNLLRIRGANLSKGDVPEVYISGDRVEVLEASSNELLVRPMSHHTEGELAVHVGDEKALGFYELAPRAGAAPGPPVAKEPRPEASPVSEQRVVQGAPSGGGEEPGR